MPPFRPFNLLVKFSYLLIQYYAKFLQQVPTHCRSSLKQLEKDKIHLLWNLFNDFINRSCSTVFNSSFINFRMLY